MFYLNLISLKNYPIFLEIFFENYLEIFSNASANEVNKLANLPNERVIILLSSTIALLDP